ncbi:MAG: MFS transporter [Archaeoglobales archaeon]|nr:MFS transporter [Archaeoglobales archaeon]
MKKWILFATVSTIYFFVYLHRTSTAVLADLLISEFSITAISIGLFTSAYFYTYSALQIPVGYLSDTFGARKVVSFFTFLLFLGVTIFSLAPNFELALFGRMLIGFGAAGVYVPSVMLFSRLYKPYEFATILGIFFAIGNAGSIFSSYPLAVLTSLLGWRTVFGIIATFTVLMLIIFFLVSEDYTEKRIEKIKLNDFVYIAISRNLWCIGLTSFLRYGAAMGFQGVWGGLFLMEVYKLGREEVGIILLIMASGVLIGAPVLGYLSDLTKSRKWIIFLGSLGVTICWIPLTFKTSSMHIWELCFISFALGFFGGSGSTTYALIKEFFPPKSLGLASSMHNVFPFLGATAFQVIMGYIIDLLSENKIEAYSYAFGFCLVSCILSVVLSILIQEGKSNYR